jgi:hypothetical protein
LLVLFRQQVVAEAALLASVETHLLLSMELLLAIPAVAVGTLATKVAAWVVVQAQVAMVLR